MNGDNSVFGIFWFQVAGNYYPIYDAYYQQVEFP